MARLLLIRKSGQRSRGRPLDQAIAANDQGTTLITIRGDMETCGEKTGISDRLRMEFEGRMVPAAIEP